MEQLMEIARRAADRVEIYSAAGSSDQVSFENGKLKDIESSRLSHVNLLLIKDGKLGFAYTRNLIGREALVQNALDSLEAGVEADYELPLTKNPPGLATYDDGIDQLTNTMMVEECQRVCDALAPKTTGQVNVAAERETSTIRVMNSAGTDVSARFSEYSAYASILYPGSYSSISRYLTARGMLPFPDEDLDFVLGTYNASLKEVKAPKGRTKVLFLPETMYVLVWRLLAATSGKSVFEKVSPLLEKQGEQVLSDKLFIASEPTNDSWPRARSFDDEGTACRELPLFDAGVLKGFYYDRYYAWKAGAEPTGHGFRSGTNRAAPASYRLGLRPGESSFGDLLKQMGSGIIVAGAMGAHSGNIMHGEYSVGLSPALRVEDGAVVGHVKDAMVAGNVYDTMKEVVAIGDKQQFGYMGWFPAVLFDNVSFATKG